MIPDATGKSEFNLHMGLMGLKNQGSFTGSIGTGSYLASADNEMYDKTPARSYIPQVDD
jgi:hypothetical protein